MTDRRPGTIGIVGLAVAAILAIPSLALADTSRSGAPDTGNVPDVVGTSLEDQRAVRLDALLQSTGTLGSYVDPKIGFVVVVPSSGSSVFRPEDAAALGFDAIVKTVDLELDEIRNIKDLVATVMWKPGPGILDPAADFVPLLGKVVIDTDAPEEMFKAVFDKYGDRVAYQAGGIHLASRCADWEGTRGHFGSSAEQDPAISGGFTCGGNSSQPFQCSSGFSTKNSLSHWRMVTAAHCFVLGDAVVSPGDDSFGTVKSRDGWSAGGPDPGALYDFELIGGPSIRQGHYIYTGNNATGTEKPVESGRDVGSGYTWCHGGMVTFEHCGLNFAGYGSYTDGGVDFYWFHIYGACGDGPQQGDSGGPVYRILGDGNVEIGGITNGYPASTSCTGGKTSDLFGTNLTQITCYYHLALLTMSNDP